MTNQQEITEISMKINGDGAVEAICFGTKGNAFKTASKALKQKDIESILWEVLNLKDGSRETVRRNYTKILIAINERTLGDALDAFRDFADIENEKTTLSPYKNFYKAFAQWASVNWNFEAKRIKTKEEKNK